VKRPGSFRLMATALVFSWIFTLTPTSLWAADLEISLIPDFDQIGSQIETIQVYKDINGERLMFGIYDTGASVISISADDQAAFSLLGVPEVPILVHDGAIAEGIGGGLIGDVSNPGIIMADGLHAFTIDLDNFDFSIDTSHALQVPNIQACVGTVGGSAALPSITGTPIHSTGMAAKIDLLGYQLDFGDGLIINIPDMSFVTPGTPDAVLPGTGLTPTPVRIPLQLLGENNYTNPGDSVTSLPNPVQNSITLRQGDNHDGTYAANFSNKTLLFDTGAQMSIISTALAAGLGFDLNAPTITIDVQGAAGNAVTVPGFTLDALELPRDDDGNGLIDGKLKLTQVPIFVLDLGVDGLDGILGMNLWNTAVGMLYDPSDPNNAYVNLTFSDDPNRGLDPEEIEALTLLSQVFPAFGGALRNKDLIKIPDITSSTEVPEPSTWILLVIGVTGLLFHHVRGRRL